MLGIGQDFEEWLSSQEENNLSSKCKVHFNVCLCDNSLQLILQAHQILRMWESFYGDKVSPVKIVAALKKMPKTENIISEIMKHCT